MARIDRHSCMNGADEKVMRARARQFAKVRKGRPEKKEERERNEYDMVCWK